MSLHECEHSFEELAVGIFPVVFLKLAASLRSPIPLRFFHETPALIPARAGCYVVVQRNVPIYVGIAKNMRRRILDHLSCNPSRANLAVRMTAKSLGVSLSGVKKHVEFEAEMKNATTHLLDSGVGWVEIANPLEMYLFEPYCAMKLDTSEYNFFDTLQIFSPKN